MSDQETVTKEENSGESVSESTVHKVKEEISKRNRLENKEVVNTHMLTCPGGNMALLCFTYKDGTFDKHHISLNRKKFCFLVDEMKKIVKYQKNYYKLIPIKDGEIQNVAGS